MKLPDDRLPGLDLLRSIAIVWVMLFHSFVVGGLGGAWSWLSRFGWMGVDLFFVLSGFLIGGQLFAVLARGERLLLGDFYLRRALRILPAYWAVLGIYLLWPAFREAPGMEPAWKFLLFVVNLDIDYLRNTAFSHAWSLCVEEHFYLLFPLLALGLAGWTTPRRFVIGLAVLMLAGIVLRAVLWWHGLQGSAHSPRNWYIEDLYDPTWCRLDGLLCGVALAALRHFRPQAWQGARRHANAVLLVGLAGVVLSFALFEQRTELVGNTLGWPVLSLALAALVFAGAGRDSWIGARAVPGARWVAGISFSLYLVHKAVYHLVQAQVGDALAGQGLLAFALYGASAFLGGALLHYSVERPCLRLRGRLVVQRQGPAVLTRHA